jgi:hypothetical protein
MALVRCPKHKIPYNDANPRGCPACAQEKEGGRASRQLGAMQELARASQVVRRPSTTGSALAVPEAPVTTQPRLPTPVETRIAQVLALVRSRSFLTAGCGLILLLILVLVLSTQARFSSADSPARYSGVVRPFPVNPNDPIAMVFSAVGPQVSQPNPTARTLERYSYGTDLYVDALNGAVYAITLAVPNRSWRGLRVGLNQTNIEGTLALLGTPFVADSAMDSRADTISGFVVYRNLDLRPRRTLMANVRPPNGCYDAFVDIQPRAIGVLTKGQDRWAVITRVGGVQDWVVTRVRVVSRAVAGPYSGEPAC